MEVLMGNSSIKGPFSILNHPKSPFCCGEKLLLNSPQLYLRSFWRNLRLLLGLSRNVQKCVCYVCYVVHIYIFTYLMFVYDCICISSYSSVYIWSIIYIILNNILQLYDMEPEGLAMAHEVTVARNSHPSSSPKSKWTTLVYEPHENYVYMYIYHKP